MYGNVAWLDYKSAAGRSYLDFLTSVWNKGLLVPGANLDLTLRGFEIVDTSFGSELDTTRVVDIVNRMRQGNPHYSELDAFVAEAADVIYCQQSDDDVQKVSVLEDQFKLSRKDLFFLAGIGVYREGIKLGRIKVEPQKSGNAQVYISYNSASEECDADDIQL